MPILPNVWNFFWNASTAIVTVAGVRAFVVLLHVIPLLKDEVPILAAVNMPFTANAGESIASDGWGYEKLLG